MVSSLTGNYVHLYFIILLILIAYTFYFKQNELNFKPANNENK